MLASWELRELQNRWNISEDQNGFVWEGKMRDLCLNRIIFMALLLSLIKK